MLALFITLSCGVLLLSLPWAYTQPVALIDLIFTAVSATSGTGLLTVPLESFTMFGHLVILALIQIGGLGIITFSIFLISFFMELGLGTQVMAGSLLELESIRRARKLITFIVIVTLCSELIGTLLIWASMPSPSSGASPLFHALFHSVSAFCNTGMTFFPLTQPALRNNSVLLLVTALLATLGGLGFISLHDIIMRIWASYRKKRAHISLHTKIVVAITCYITVIACCLICLLEYRAGFAHLTIPAKLVNALFDAVCARSAGFTTLDIAMIRLPTLLLIIMVTFIGSSPGSTGGGIKTTTFAILYATIRAVISGRMTVELRERTVPPDQVLKAMAVFSLSLTWISIALFLLLITEEGFGLTNLMFEAFSAFANLGLSTGITPHLSRAGKWLIMALMIIGRIGSLTLIFALRPRQEKVGYRYPEERVALS